MADSVSGKEKTQEKNCNSNAIHCPLAAKRSTVMHECTEPHSCCRSGFCAMRTISKHSLYTINTVGCTRGHAFLLSWLRSDVVSCCKKCSAGCLCVISTSSTRIAPRCCQRLPPAYRLLHVDSRSLFRARNARFLRCFPSLSFMLFSQKAHQNGPKSHCLSQVLEVADMRL